MIIINGEGVCSGVAFGRLKKINKTFDLALNTHIENADEELFRFETARTKALKQLDELYNKAL